MQFSINQIMIVFRIKMIIEILYLALPSSNSASIGVARKLKDLEISSYCTLTELCYNPWLADPVVKL